MSKYYLHGEYEVLLNGIRSSVLVAIACPNESEAYVLMENRQDIYKNMYVDTSSQSKEYKKK